MSLKLYNYKTGKKSQLETYTPGIVNMYNCGPTAYADVHIGNLRAYASWDFVHRGLEYLGYKVVRYTNFTDVGHLVQDSNLGEDKVYKASKALGKNFQDTATHFITNILSDFAKLNIRHPDGVAINIRGSNITKEIESHNWLLPSSHISEIIAMIKALEKKGHTYETNYAVWFSVDTYKEYDGWLGPWLEGKISIAQAEITKDQDKRDFRDFALWVKSSVSTGEHLWDSPWGRGFPGWHIGCSCMSCTALDNKIDIHTGGPDHIQIHHANERAQNFGVFGNTIVKQWVYNGFIVGKDGIKLGKSLSNGVSLAQLEQEGITPLDVRYLFLTSLYNEPLMYDMDELQKAKKAYRKLISEISKLKKESKNAYKSKKILYNASFINALEDNINTPRCLAVVYKVLQSNYSALEKLKTIEKYDQVLGLNLIENAKK